MNTESSPLRLGATLNAAAVRKIIESYVPPPIPGRTQLDPVAVHNKARFLALLDQYPDTFANRYNYDLGAHGHMVATAYVFNPTIKSIALAQHKQLGYWLGFGGHAEPEDTDLLSTAFHEASEEGGLKNLVLTSTVPIDIDIHGFPSKGDQPDHYHYDVRFLYTTNDTDFAPAEGESKEIQWFPVANLHNVMEKWVSNNRLVRYLQHNLG